MEGIRLLPLLKEEAQRAPGSIPHLLDCHVCKRDRDPEERLDLGCGYEERSVERPSGLWSHPAHPDVLEYDRELDDGRMVPGRRVCAGYSCKLPAVLQLVPIQRHLARRGTVTERYGQLPEVVWERLDELDDYTEVARAHAFRLKQGAGK